MNRVAVVDEAICCRRAGLGLENYSSRREEAGLCGSVIGPCATGSDV